MMWDVVIIGGGPAGMMAGAQASALGAKVLLLEKNTSLGKKLLITGGGRCNVTNAETNVRTLLSKFKDSDKYLFSPFSKWGVTETLSFFNTRGMATKVEPGKRVFPVSDKAQSVWDVLVNELRDTGVEVQSNTTVLGFEYENHLITGVKTKKGVIQGKQFILATGGKSRPETGSTGDGFDWLRSMGHTVHEPTAALVPITVHESWISRIAGVALEQAKITTFQNNEKQDVNRGKILFTHVGLSGPAILNMSKDIGELLKYGDVRIEIDLLSQFDYAQLNTELQKLFAIHANKKFKNALGDLLPQALAACVIDLSGINPDIQCNSITRETRLSLITLLKHFSLNVASLLGEDKAIVTSGGIDLTEVDFSTMQSRIFPNLYVVGDVLDIDRPSGGYSLQLCWTTGFVAGTESAKACIQNKKFFAV